MSENPLECPKCHGEMHEMNMEGVVFDFCDGCKGIWFDKDEMAFYVELPVDMPEIEEVKKAAKKTGLKCPRCTQELEEMKFTKASDLLIDRCGGCQGIYLDKGELRKVESLACNMMDPKSRLFLVGKQFKDKGYQFLGIRPT